MSPSIVVTAAHEQICRLSAGELKRLSLATQLLRKPDLIILDGKFGLCWFVFVRFFGAFPACTPARAPSICR